MEISTIAMMGVAGICLLTEKTLAWKKEKSARPAHHQKTLVKIDKNPEKNKQRT